VFRGSLFLVCFVPFLFKIIPSRFAHFSLQPSHFLPCLSTVGQAKADLSAVKKFFVFGLLRLFVALPQPPSSVSISIQVDKTLANAGFLERVDGHCQRNCQYRGGCKHNSPKFVNSPLKLAH